MARECNQVYSLTNSGDISSYNVTVSINAKRRRRNDTYRHFTSNFIREQCLNIDSIIPRSLFTSRREINYISRYHVRHHNMLDQRLISEIGIVKTRLLLNQIKLNFPF